MKGIGRTSFARKKKDEDQIAGKGEGGGGRAGGEGIRGGGKHLFGEEMLVRWRCANAVKGRRFLLLVGWTIIVWGK